MKPIDLQFESGVIRLSPIGRRWMRVEVFQVRPNGERVLDRQFLHDAGMEIHNDHSWNITRLNSVHSQISGGIRRIPIPAKELSVDEGVKELWKVVMYQKLEKLMTGVG